MKTPLLWLFTLMALGAPLAQAQENTVYVSEWHFTGEPAIDILTPLEQRVAVYHWPDFDRISLSAPMPAHDAMAISADRRELILFAANNVYVLDRLSLNPLRTFTLSPAPPMGWANQPLISPARPAVVMMRTGHWINVLTGAFEQTPSSLAPGYQIDHSALDDEGRYVTLSLSRSLDGTSVERVLRVINLDGSDIARRDIAGGYFGVTLSGGRIVVARSDVPTTLEVLDLATLGVQSTLSMPAPSSLRALNGDGLGGVTAVIGVSGGNRLLQWPRAQQAPIERQTITGPYYQAQLRVQQGKVLVLRPQYFGCLIICFPDPVLLTVFDPSQGTHRSLGPAIVQDAALMPLGNLVEPVPGVGNWGMILLALSLIVATWRSRAVVMRRAQMDRIDD